METCIDENGFDDTKICQELISAVQNSQKSTEDIRRTNKKEGADTQIKD